MKKFIMLITVLMLSTFVSAIPNDPMILSGEVRINDVLENGELKFYVDGVLQATQSTTNGLYGQGFDPIVLTGDDGTIVTIEFVNGDYSDVSTYRLIFSSGSFNSSTLEFTGTDITIIVEDTTEDSSSDSGSGSSSYSSGNGTIIITNTTTDNETTTDVEDSESSESLDGDNTGNETVEDNIVFDNTTSIVVDQTEEVNDTIDTVEGNTEIVEEESNTVMIFAIFGIIIMIVLGFIFL